MTASELYQICDALRHKASNSESKLVDIYIAGGKLLCGIKLEDFLDGIWNSSVFIDKDDAGLAFIPASEIKLVTLRK